VVPNAEAVFKSEADFKAQTDLPLRRTLALKTITPAFLNRKIQTAKKGHDCLEDTFATRDVVIWYLRNPDLLATWSKHARTDHEVRKRDSREKKEREEKEK
jgi:hypothetical protein